MNTQNINRSIIESIVGKFSVYVIQIISIMVLSRAFTPQEFGVIASIQVFIIFFQLFSDFGISPALINEDTINDRQRDGVFTFTLFLGVIVSVIFYLFTYGLNSYYNKSIYDEIGLISSFSILFTCLSILPLTSLLKDLKLITISKVDALCHLLSLIVTLLLLMKVNAILALASKPTTYAAFRLGILFYLSDKTNLGSPRFGGDVSFVRKIMSFSLYQFGFNFINYFARNLDAILIAKYIGSQQLGIYDRSYQIMRYPVMLTTGAFTSAIQPAIKKLGMKKNDIVNFHNLLSKKLVLISVPTSIYIYLNADYIVDVMLGSQWSNVAPLIEILSISLPVQIVISTSGAFFQALGKPKLLFIAGCIGSLIFTSSIVISIIFVNIKYTAFAISFSFIINGFFVYYILFKFAFEREVYSFIFMILNLSRILLPSLFIYIVVNKFLNEYLNLLDYNAFFILIVSFLVMIASFSFNIKKILSILKS